MMITAQARNLIFESGLIAVIFVFSLVIVFNVFSLFAVGGSSFVGIVSFVKFDSWGTIAGLAGVVVLFVPVLLGRQERRVTLSLYFALGSVAIGLFSGILWSEAYSSSVYGSSSIAIAALAILFTLSCTGLVRLSRGTLPGYLRNAYAFVFCVLILTTLWFIFILQPIFVPSSQYNWMVHEIAFGLGVISTIIFELIVRR